jgi:hypothetical protein
MPKVALRLLHCPQHTRSRNQHWWHNFMISGGTGFALHLRDGFGISFTRSSDLVDCETERLVFEIVMVAV